MDNKTRKPKNRISRNRILMIAYACSPYRGSEAGMGWHRAVEAAKYFDVWVICEKRESEVEVKRYLQENGEIPGLYFYFLGMTTLQRRLWKIPGLLYLGYNLWHRRAYQVAILLHKKFSFDCAHQVNICGFREPGYLRLLGIPFIWGPIGGTQNYPWRFLGRAGFFGAIREGTRNLINVLQLRLSPRVRQAAQKAAVLLTANSTGQKDFMIAHQVDPVILLETGVTTLKENPPDRDYSYPALIILWSGQFLRTKALDLLLHALATMPPLGDYELRILGKGPMEKKWRKLSRRLGIESRCNWMGWLELDEVMKQYDWADIFVFTSLRDTSGNVLLEALGYGVPVICLDHQGAKDIVTERCGIKIPITTYNKVTRDLRDAILSIAYNKKRLNILSSGAIERAKLFTWSVNGAKMSQIYSNVINGNHKQVSS